MADVTSAILKGQIRAHSEGDLFSLPSEVLQRFQRSRGLVCFGGRKNQPFGILEETGVYLLSCARNEKIVPGTYLYPALVMIDVGPSGVN